MIKNEEINRLIYEQDYIYSIPKKIQKIKKLKFGNKDYEYFYSIDDNKKLNYFLINKNSKFGSKNNVQILTSLETPFDVKDFVFCQDKILINNSENIFINDIFEENKIKTNFSESKKILKQDFKIIDFALNEKESKLIIYTKNSNFLFLYNLPDLKPKQIIIRVESLKLLKYYQNNKCTFLTQSKFFVMKDLRDNSVCLTINESKKNIKNYCTNQKNIVITIEDDFIRIYDIRKHDKCFWQKKYANEKFLKIKKIEFDEERDIFYLNDQIGNHFVVDSKNEETEIIGLREVFLKKILKVIIIVEVL